MAEATRNALDFHVSSLKTKKSIVQTILVRENQESGHSRSRLWSKNAASLDVTTNNDEDAIDANDANEAGRRCVVACTATRSVSPGEIVFRLEAETPYGLPPTHTVIATWGPDFGITPRPRVLASASWPWRVPSPPRGLGGTDLERGWELLLSRRDLPSRPNRDRSLGGFGVPMMRRWPGVRLQKLATPLSPWFRRV